MKRILDGARKGRVCIVEYRQHSDAAASSDDGMPTSHQLRQKPIDPVD